MIADRVARAGQPVLEQIEIAGAPGFAPGSGQRLDEQRDILAREAEIEIGHLVLAVGDAAQHGANEDFAHHGVCRIERVRRAILVERRGRAGIGGIAEQPEQHSRLGIVGRLGGASGDSRLEQLADQRIGEQRRAALEISGLGQPARKGEAIGERPARGLGGELGEGGERFVATALRAQPAIVAIAPVRRIAIGGAADASQQFEGFGKQVQLGCGGAGGWRGKRSSAGSITAQAGASSVQIATCGARSLGTSIKPRRIVRNCGRAEDWPMTWVPHVPQKLWVSVLPLAAT